MVHIKDPFLIKAISHIVMAAGFFSHYLSDPLPYVQCHYLKNVLSVSLRKILPSTIVAYKYIWVFYPYT